MKKKAGTKDKNLKRKIEILKAQLSSSQDVFIPQQTVIQSPNYNRATQTHKEADLKINAALIKKDLLRTFLLSTLAFSIILTIKLI